MSDAADRLMDATETLDPSVCDTHGHLTYTVTLCQRCGEEIRLHPSEDTR